MGQKTLFFKTIGYCFFLNFRQGNIKTIVLLRWQFRKYLDICFINSLAHAMWYNGLVTTYFIYLNFKVDSKGNFQAVKFRKLPDHQIGVKCSTVVTNCFPQKSEHFWIFKNIIVFQGLLCGSKVISLSFANFVRVNVFCSFFFVFKFFLRVLTTILWTTY